MVYSVSESLQAFDRYVAITLGILRESRSGGNHKSGERQDNARVYVLLARSPKIA